MRTMRQYPMPLGQAYELDLASSICEGLVSYIACLPQHGMVPREFHPNGENRAFTRAGTTGTELKARISTATLRGRHSAYPMATVSTGAGDVWTLSYGSNSIIDVARPACLVTLGYCNAVSTTAKRMVRYTDSSNLTSVMCVHGNGTVSRVIGTAQVTGSLFATAETAAPTAGTDLLHAYEYSPGAGTQTIYVDGVATTPAASTAQTANLFSVAAVSWGNNSAGGAPFNGGIALSGLWNRTLSEAEHRALALDPYLPLRRTRLHMFSVPSFRAAWATASRARVHGAGMGV